MEILTKFWEGRSGRGEFWASVGGLVVALVVVGFFLAPRGLLGSWWVLVWIAIAGRRLHDLGHGRGWAMLPILIPMATPLLVLYSVSIYPWVWPALTLFNIFVVVGAVGYLGVARGSVFANAYGPPIEKPTRSPG